jgi:threonine synthase
MTTGLRFIGYRCSTCGKEYPPDNIFYTCPVDGGNVDVILDYDTLRATLQPEQILRRPERSIWRYQALLPVSRPSDALLETPLGAVGDTPTYRLRRLGEKLQLQSLWLKDESRNPSASFKDRASAVVVARALEIGQRTIVAASTGNAGAALACMAAAADVRALIFIPKAAPPAKIAQLRIFGARLSTVDGNYDEAYEKSLEASREWGWYNRNTGYNPFTAEGKKTAAFEIWEWAFQHKIRKRLTIFVSVGDGNIISGLHKGFKDLEALGWLESIGGMPRLVGVQASGSAAIFQAFHARRNVITPIQAHTIADSISVNMPRDGLRAIRAARETDGTFVQVSDQDILEAITELGQQGIFAEPAGAAAWAGLTLTRKENLLPNLHDDDPVLVLNTGSGLKDVQAAEMSVPPPSKPFLIQ